MWFVLSFCLALCLVMQAPAGAGENRLTGESSLYLRQHADQPIDWYPWGEEALEKARREGKLIFVSVGYAACHWCHVMAEESFENEAIAARLNARFVSIKIDRERRPDLDEQFNLVSTMLSGSAGWPNSIFLTPDGEPFHAGGYFPPDDFLQLLVALAEAWDNDRPALAAFAFETAARVRGYLDQAAVLGEVSSRDILDAARRTVSDLDPFNGGFGTAPKFPREPFLLFVLDQAARTGDPALLEAITTTLDGMIRGAVHDQIGGGFHRYAIDPEWQIPHFEKMLYTQALMGRVLLRAYALTGNRDYARAARRTLDYVLRDMRAPQGAFFAAQDADSILATGAREEGRFYVWTPQQVAAVLGDSAAPVAAALNIETPGSFEGRSIPHLGQSAQETAAFLGIPITRFDAFLETMRAARAKRPAPIRDEKIILSWNAEMIATLAEAASVLERPDYFDAARKATDFLTGRLQTERGLSRILFEGRADTPAQLSDVAGLGLALLALCDHGPDCNSDSNLLASADRLAQHMLGRFADDGQALRMTHDAAGLGPFRPLDDTELASGNAQALAFLAGLDRRLARSAVAAPALAAAIALDAINLPAQRAGLLQALEQARQGPSGPMRVSTGGAVHVLARAERRAGQMVFEIGLRDGWHINAHQPLEDYLIGMALEVNGLALPADGFPDPVIRNLGFSPVPLALYETGFRLAAPLRFPASGPAKATLALQACNHEQCLPPDEMVFFVWPGPQAGEDER